MVLELTGSRNSTRLSFLQANKRPNLAHVDGLHVQFSQAWKQVVEETLLLLKRGIDPEMDFEGLMFSEEPFHVVKSFESSGSMYYLHAKGYGYDIDFHIITSDSPQLDQTNSLHNEAYEDFVFDPNHAEERVSEAFKDFKRRESSPKKPAADSLAEYIKTRLAQGATQEQIRRDLLEHFADAIGIRPERLHEQVDKAREEADTVAREFGVSPDRIYRWQCNGTKVCYDCRCRNGEEDTYAHWVIRGLPRKFGSRCSDECHCTLIDTGQTF
jgi:hypothetical protein